MEDMRKKTGLIAMNVRGDKYVTRGRPELAQHANLHISIPHFLSEAVYCQIMSQFHFTVVFSALRAVPLQSIYMSQYMCTRNHIREDSQACRGCMSLAGKIFC